MNYDSKKLALIYERKITSQNLVNDIVSEIEKYFDEEGFFTQSDFIDQVLESDDNPNYRQFIKAPTLRRISEELTEIMSKLNLLFDINELRVWVDIEPDLGKNYHIGGGFYPKYPPTGLIRIKLDGVIKDREKFLNELEYVMVHELVHARQIYTSHLQKKEFKVIASAGNIKNFFEEYLSHPFELEAFAIEYNFRNDNVYDERKIIEFAIEIVNFGKMSKLFEGDSFEKSDKYEEYKDAFMNFVSELKDAIRKFPFHLSHFDNSSRI